ncbi:RNA pseudouridine synthase 5-like [Actinidia eriantha]|uniref:RNA pseudouridine synthase 5-like n=1 Tax=Actinidia eriantha TaxID=165200 RepID=UPI00258D1166|nr:RNA pseudouridine synthase 5-like [Actinidia eriantha]
MTSNTAEEMSNTAEYREPLTVSTRSHENSIFRGSTLIEFYSSKHPNSAPLQGWLQRIGNRQITIDDSVVTDPNTVIRAGSELFYYRIPWKEPDAPYLLEVLFEDDDYIHVLICVFIALNKPSGLQGLPGGLFQQRTVLTQLQWLATRKCSSLAHQAPHPVPVHWLGRGTSGKPALSMVKFKKLARQVHVGRGKPTGTVLHYSDLFNRWRLQSGRPHQIRIHLSFIGRPLIDDPLYVTGGRPKCFDPEVGDGSFVQDRGYERPAIPVPGDTGYFLHAHQLVLSHPTSSEVSETSIKY